MVFKNRQQIMIFLISLFVAFVLWLYFMGDKNPVQNRVIENIPVTLTNIENISDSDLALVPNQNLTVNLTITGRTFDIYNVKPEDFRVEADMSGYLKKGDNKIPVEVKSSPRGVSITSKSGYTYVKVRLDTFLEKSVPVTVTVSGDAKTGYGYIQPDVKPMEALVSGPATYVSMVTSVSGQIDISKVTEDITGSIPIKALDEKGRVVSYVTVEPRYVDITVPIKPAKEVPVIVDITGTMPGGKILKSAKPKFDRVTILGDKNVIDKINEISTVKVNAADIDTTASNDIALKLPAGISLSDGSRSIIVDFVVENKIENTLSIPVTFVNQNDSYNYTYSATSLSVMLSGGESTIDSTDVKDITAKVDLKDLPEGTHSITPRVTAPDGIDVGSIDPQKITITVTKK